MAALVTGDTFDRVRIYPDGKIEIGSGALARDVVLYRSAADVLKTDDSFIVGTDLTVTGAFNGASNVNTGAWTSYTPTWTASGTAVALGNGVLVGRYQRIGRTIIYHINFIPGSTSTYGSGVYSFALPVAAANQGQSFVGSAHLLNSGGTIRWPGQNIISPSASATTPFFPASTHLDTRLTAMGPADPETFASGTQLRITGIYEAAS
jgi:hypothetical protein